MKIEYKFLTGELLEVEVSEELGKASMTIDREIHNNDRRETRRHNSIEALEEKGQQFFDETIDVQVLFERTETLKTSIRNLLPQQKNLLMLAQAISGRVLLREGNH